MPINVLLMMLSPIPVPKLFVWLPGENRNGDNSVYNIVMTSNNHKEANMILNYLSNGDGQRKNNSPCEIKLTTRKLDTPYKKNNIWVYGLIPWESDKYVKKYNGKANGEFK